VQQPKMRSTRVPVAATEAAFDAFDEDAQAADATPESHNGAAAKTDEHGHVPVSTEYSPKTGKKLRIFVGLLAIALLIGFFAANHSRRQQEGSLREEAALRVQEPLPVETVRVQQRPSKQTLILPGETRGWYSSTIYARVTGYVAQWLVDIGDPVKKDQIMAKIDTPDLDAQLDAAQAQLTASEAEAKVKESDADFAKTTYVRWQTSPKGAVSEQEREDKKAHYESSVAQLNAALARVNLDRANVDRLRYLTQFKEVSAPYDGVITERRIDIGDLVTAGSTNTTPLFGIAQFDRIRVFANIPQSARVDLSVGQMAHIRAAELPGRVFEGAITRTSESEDPRARTLRVEIDLPNDDRALVPGVYVQVAFDLPSKPSIQVPAGALIFRGGGPQVAVIAEDETVKFRDVRIARDDGKFVEIGSGLKEGDRVALNINNRIVEGDKVTVRQVAENVQKAK
jgi:membrane fusion protein, multidrug efflux system